MTVGMGDDDAVGGELFPPGTVDLCRLVDTYGWWRQPFTWLAWHIPVVRTMMRWVFKANPYRRIIARVDAVSALRGRGKSS